MVCRTCREMFDIRGEKNARDVVVVSFKLGDGYELCLFPILKEVPDIDTALLVVSITTTTGNAQLTEFVPAHSVEPSLATVTLATGQSSSGIN